MFCMCTSREDVCFMGVNITDVIEHRHVLGSNQFTISTWCRWCTPIEMIYDWCLPKMCYFTIPWPWRELFRFFLMPAKYNKNDNILKGLLKNWSRNMFLYANILTALGFSCKKRPPSTHYFAQYFWSSFMQSCMYYIMPYAGSSSEESITWSAADM